SQGCACRDRSDCRVVAGSARGRKEQSKVLPALQKLTPKRGAPLHAILITSVRAINEKLTHASWLVFEARAILCFVLFFLWHSRLQPGNHFDLDKRILGKTRHLHS